MQNYNDYLLKVLKSIYGETFAPKRWQQTLQRGLEELGYKRCQLDESLYFKVQDDQVSIISTYVDDVWIFAMNPDTMVRDLWMISKSLRCTPAEILCGAPSWMWNDDNENEASHEKAQAGKSEISSRAALTTEQRAIKEFFAPLEGPQRFGVATKSKPLSVLASTVSSPPMLRGRSEFQNVVDHKLE